MKLITHYPGDQEGDPHQGRNWRENFLTDSLYYSFRKTHYDRSTYPSVLHYHDYYELVVFVSGEVRYLCEGETFRPHPGDMILIPPGRLHMSATEADRTCYERHVFYFYPDAFAFAPALTQFALGAKAMLTARADEELPALLSRMDAALAADTPTSQALALGLCMQIFYHFGLSHFTPGSCDPLPDQVLRIQRWLDENFAQVENVAQAAGHFFYSREYVSRLWKKHFGTTVADYLMKRRVSHAQQLIVEGHALTDVCYQCGFGSMSTFIRAFRQVSGITPSQYRRMKKPCSAANL